MSDDTLRIKPKVNGTAESKAGKVENEEAIKAENKPAEVQVGQELTKSSQPVSDVEFKQTEEQREAKKQEEEARFLDDIEKMAGLDSSEETSENADLNMPMQEMLKQSSNPYTSLTFEALSFKEPSYQEIVTVSRLLEENIPPDLDLANLSEKQRLLFNGLKSYLFSISSLTENSDFREFGKKYINDFISKYLFSISIADSLKEDEYKELLKVKDKMFFNDILGSENNNNGQIGQNNNVYLMAHFLSLSKNLDEIFKGKTDLPVTSWHIRPNFANSRFRIEPNKPVYNNAPLPEEVLAQLHFPMPKTMQLQQHTPMEHFLAADTILSRLNPNNFTERQKKLYEIFKTYTLRTAIGNIDLKDQENMGFIPPTGFSQYGSYKRNYNELISNFIRTIKNADFLSDKDYDYILNRAQELINPNTHSDEFLLNSSFKFAWSSLRYILAGKLKSSPDGDKIALRIQFLSKEAQEKIFNDTDLCDLLDANDLPFTFDNVSNILELLYGITLRVTKDEFEKSRPQMEQIVTQCRAQSLMTNVFLLQASWFDQYTDNLGLFGLFAEGCNYAGNKIVGIKGTNGEHSDIAEAIRGGLNYIGIGLRNGYQMKAYFEECAQRAAALKPLNPEQFKQGFRGIQGEFSERYGIKYNMNAFKRVIELADSGKARNKDGSLTEEYKKALSKAINMDLYNPNDDKMITFMNGFGEAVLMLMTLGWASEAKGGQVLAETSMNVFGRLGSSIAAKQVNNALLKGALRFAGKGVSLLGPAIPAGANMYAYSLATGSAANLGNRIVKGDWEKYLATQGMVMKGANSSFVFGAFAGIFGATVTQRVMNFVSKTSSKVSSSLAAKFAQSANGVLSANEVYATILEKSVPTKLAEAAAFCTDVLGFTAFETASNIISNLDSFKGDLTVDKVTDILWKEFKGQGYNLGQIKVVSHLIMWMKGSQGARAAMRLNQLNPNLNGIGVEMNGNGYNLILPGGRKIACKNANEMISSLHLVARGQIAFDKRFDEVVAEQEARLKLIKALEKQQKEQEEVKPKPAEKTENKPAEKTENKSAEKTENKPATEEYQVTDADKKLCHTDEDPVKKVNSPDGSIILIFKNKYKLKINKNGEKKVIEPQQKTAQNINKSGKMTGAKPVQTTQPAVAQTGTTENKPTVEITVEECAKIINDYKPIELPKESRLKIKKRITDPNELQQALQKMSTPYDTPEIVKERAKALVAGRLEPTNGHASTLLNDANLTSILGKAAENINNADKGKKIIIITGRPGSGKSTYIDKQLAGGKGYFLVDADEIKKSLPGYSEYGANFTHPTSATLARAELESAMSNSANIVYPTTGSAEQIIKLAQEHGYAVEVVYCDVPEETCVQRAMNRFEEEHRFVDPFFITKAPNEEAVQNVCNKYKIGLKIVK